MVNYRISCIFLGIFLGEVLNHGAFPVQSHCDLTLIHCKLGLYQEKKVLDNKLIDDISRKVSGMIAGSPMADVEKNVRALLQTAFAKLDLVTREEFDVQTQVLQRTREQLSLLEQRLAVLEAGQTKE
jgi:ubiquinone biosynthesis accessory factor UbiK